MTINPTEPFSNIVDCASNCKAKPLNTMFAFETSKGCGDSDGDHIIICSRKTNLCVSVCVAKKLRSYSVLRTNYYCRTGK